MDIYGITRRVLLTGLCINVCAASFFLWADPGSRAADLFWEGKSQSAFNTYQKISKKDPSNLSALKNASVLAADLKLKDDQKNLLLEFCEQRPQSVWGWKNLGWFALDSDDSDNAARYFSTALTFNATDYESLLGMGIYYHARDQLTEAASYYHILEQYYPDSAAIAYLLGAVCLDRDEYEKGEYYGNRSLKNDYAMVESRYLLSKIFMRSMQAEKAWTEVQKLLNIDPSSIIAREFKEAELFASVKQYEKEEKKSKKLKLHSSVKIIAEPGSAPFIDVGLLVDGKGGPQKITSVRCNLKGTVALTLANNINLTLSSEDFAEWDVRLSTDSTGIELRDEKDTLRACTTSYIVFTPATTQDTVIVREVPYATGYAWAGQNDREYRGTMIISRRHDRLVIVNRVLFEEYFFGVLPSEMISSWPKEALKAQAVIARGFSWIKKNDPAHRRKYGYDVCSSQHCQVYAGVSNETRRTTEAVQETQDEMLMYNKRIANTLYSSNCGGHTQSNRDLKGWGDEPFLRGVPDMADQARKPRDPCELADWIHDLSPACYCAPSKYTYAAESRWIRVVPADYVTEKINRTHKVGEVLNIIVERRSPSGHIRRLNIIGEKKNVYIEKENNIRGYLAPGGLRSTYYTVDIVRKDTKPYFFVFRGGGWGHAVGMCQSGAAGMADAGKTYAEILKHYYKGTKIGKIKR